MLIFAQKIDFNLMINLYACHIFRDIWWYTFAVVITTTSTKLSFIIESLDFQVKKENTFSEGLEDLLIDVSEIHVTALYDQPFIQPPRSEYKLLKSDWLK